MIASTRAEITKLAKRPAAWIVASVWIVLGLVFGYAFPYISYRGTLTGPEAGSGLNERVLAEALPASLVPAAIQGFPLFAGALALVAGALSAGSEYGWDTVKILHTSGPRRVSVLAGKLLALGFFMLALVLATFAADAAASLLVASLTGSAANWPPFGEVLTGVGAGWLVVSMWCVAGVFLGTLVRGTALAVGIGLVWALALENVLRIFGVILEAVDAVQRYLPGTNAGALVAALGVPVQGQPGGTPGVTDAVGGPIAAVTLAAYLVAFAVGAAVLVERHDVA
jgi:ABC-type transport system involved in multi-copper enzyme maturation permease subunit